MQSLRLVLVLTLCGPLLADVVAAQQSVQDRARAKARQLDQQREAERKRALEKRFPIGVLWVLEDLRGSRPPAGVEATLRVDSTLRGTGSSGCNRFSSSMYPGPGQTLVAGPPAITRRTCPQPVMTFERAYLQGLYSRPSWDQIGDRLILKTRSGVMRFRRSF